MGKGDGAAVRGGPVPTAGTPRSGQHGRGLPRRERLGRTRRPRPAGRPQTDPPAPLRRAGRPRRRPGAAVRPRGRDHAPPRPPRHPPPVRGRSRHLRRRAALPRHGAARRPPVVRPLRRGAATAGLLGRGVRRADRRRPGRRAHRRNRPPRPQARQRDAGARRPGQGPRLRHGPHRRRPQHRPAHQHRRDRGHRPLHGPRAVRQQPGHRRRRPVRPGLRPLRTAHRRPAVHRQHPPGTGPGTPEAAPAAPGRGSQGRTQLPGQPRRPAAAQGPRRPPGQRRRGPRRPAAPRRRRLRGGRLGRLQPATLPAPDRPRRDRGGHPRDAGIPRRRAHRRHGRLRPARPAHPRLPRLHRGRHRHPRRAHRRLPRQGPGRQVPVARPVAVAQPVLRLRRHRAEPGRRGPAARGVRPRLPYRQVPRRHHRKERTPPHPAPPPARGRPRGQKWTLLRADHRHRFRQVAVLPHPDRRPGAARTRSPGPQGGQPGARHHRLPDERPGQQPTQRTGEVPGPRLRQRPRTGHLRPLHRPGGRAPPQRTARQPARHPAHQLRDAGADAHPPR